MQEAILLSRDKKLKSRKWSLRRCQGRYIVWYFDYISGQLKLSDVRSYNPNISYGISYP